MKHSKRYNEAVQKVDKAKFYVLEEAIDTIKEIANSKFDETIEITINLGIDSRKSDQMVRGAVSLPFGTGKTKKVLVLTRSKQSEAEQAGADYAGFEDYIEKIKEGWIDFEAVVATPDSMGEVGKLGKILGPRGLMPNPKVGTVTDDVERAVKEIKAGKIDFRVDKYGILHTIVGKVSFDKEKIVENILTFIATLNRLKPASAKGTYIKKVYLGSTMSPGVKIEKNDLLNRLK